MTSLIDLLVEATNLATFLVMVGGVIAGVGVVLFTRANKRDDFDSELTDLEERRLHAVAQLRELELQRHKIDPETYDAQKDEHERMAVDALRDRDELLRKRKQPEAAARPAWHRAAWVAGLILFHGVMLWIVSPDEIPPASAMAGERAAPAAMSPELAEVWERLQKNPADVDALASGASLLAAAGRLEDARQYVERALQLDPEHPWVLLEYAALLASSEHVSEALTRLDNLVEKHPEMHEAWSLRSMIAMQAGDMEKARASLETYMKVAPEGETKTQIRSMLQGVTAPPVQDGATPNTGPPQDGGDTAAADAGAADVAADDGPTPADDGGAALWAARCSMCHGDDGKAQTGMGRALKIADFTTPAWQKTSDAHMRKVLAEGVVDENGRQRMQSFSDLSDGQLRSLISHIRAFAR